MDKSNPIETLEVKSSALFDIVGKESKNEHSSSPVQPQLREPLIIEETASTAAGALTTGISPAIVESRPTKRAKPAIGKLDDLEEDILSRAKAFLDAKPDATAPLQALQKKSKSASSKASVESSVEKSEENIEIVPSGEHADATLGAGGGGIGQLRMPSDRGEKLPGIAETLRAMDENDPRIQVMTSSDEEDEDEEESMSEELQDLMQKIRAAKEAAAARAAKATTKGTEEDTAAGSGSEVNSESGSEDSGSEDGADDGKCVEMEIGLGIFDVNGSVPEDVLKNIPIVEQQEEEDHRKELIIMPSRK